MKAIILEGINQLLTCLEVPVPVAQKGEVLVKMHAASINHRDYWIQKGQYGGLRFPSIQGSCGCGVVEKTGAGVDPSWLGKEVILNPSLNWGSDPDTQAKEYIILGMAKDGTFAEYLNIEARLLHHKPEHLTPIEAAALPLAGLTAYRALFTRARAKAGENVLVTGAGGGVALLASQFAMAAGCNVYVTSGSDDKLKRLLDIGAKGAVNYRNENWHKEIQKMSGGFEVIIDSSCGDTFAQLTDILKPAGRISIYGATLGAFNSGVPAKIFWKQLSIFGSTMGNDEDFAEMVKFTGENKIHPVVDSVYPLEEAQKAIERMERGEQFGKIVLKIS